MASTTAVEARSFSRRWQVGPPFLPPSLPPCLPRFVSLFLSLLLVPLTLGSCFVRSTFRSNPVQLISPYHSPPLPFLLPSPPPSSRLLDRGPGGNRRRSNLVHHSPTETLTPALSPSLPLPHIHPHVNSSLLLLAFVPSFPPSLSSGSWIVGLEATGAVRIWCIIHPQNPQPGDPKLHEYVRKGGREGGREGGRGGERSEFERKPNVCSNTHTHPSFPPSLPPRRR